MRFKSRSLYGIGAVALIVTAGSLRVNAEDLNIAILRRLEALEKENAKLRAEIKRVDGKVAAKPAAPMKPAPQIAAAAPIAPQPGQSPFGALQPTAGGGYIPTSDHGRVEASGNEHGWFFRKVPGPSLTFATPGGQIGMYGNFDVSIDATTKGIGKLVDPNGGTPLGRVGWQPAISTNLSYVGIRGFHKIDDEHLRFVYQLETQIDISATSGTGESNSNQSNVVRGGLTSRNSFIGVDSREWGAVKVGKTDAPYKLSTAAMNPFSGMLGDYQVIMGNTGGDNRVEFGTRLDHSIWWESPNWGGFKFAALFSPGQNRASNNDNIAAGESDCTGGNNPVSGGNVNAQNPNGACNDGSFSDAFSVSGTYTNGPFLLTAAYERHQKVNRGSDIVGIYGAPFPAASVQSLFDRDVADEDAAKIGVQFKLPTKTTIAAIFERLHRYVAKDLAFQNERQRNGTWLAVTQEITPKDEISFGWAHAFRSPGDPGQHNNAINPTPDGLSTVAGLNPHNQANMLTAVYKHKFSPALMGYIDYATTINGRDAHYDLGAGGRGVTTDCHDATGSSGGAFAGPRCWTSGRLQGISAGMKYQF